LTRLVRPSLGLIGRVVAILLLTVMIEFGASTLLYERASEFAVQDDEARRLAEHLVITQRLIAERTPEQRPAMAAELTTDRYVIRWDRVPPPLPRLAPPLDRMRSQVLDWEPSLRTTELRLAVADPGRESAVLGGLRLGDGSWIQFRTLEPVAAVNLARERILLALIPAVALMIMAGLLVRRTLRPLRQLAAAADRVGDGQSVPVPEEGPGEVQSVVRAFNRMQDRIQRLIDDRTRALAAVGHDLRTPLARLRLRSEAIADRQSREAMESELEEMEAMIASMLAYLGGDEVPEAAVRCDVAVLCATLVDDACDHGGRAQYSGPDHHEVLVRASGLKRAISNLLSNALH
jgi:signal transduction histidine kinase